jgi:hypothetical protein
VKYYQIWISETIRTGPNKEPELFKKFKVVLEGIEEIRKYLITRYGYLPRGVNKVFRDREDGTSEVVGFLHSYWIKPYNDIRNYRQTDWIEITEVTEKIVLIHTKKKNRRRGTLDDIDTVNIDNIMYYYKIADSNHDRQRLVTEMLGEIEHLIYKHSNKER